MAAFPVAMSLWPSRRGGLPQGASTCCGGGGSGSVVLRAPVATGCIRPPRALARYGSSWRASRTRPPRPGPVQPAQRVPRCPAAPRAPVATALIRLCGLASARRDGAHAASRVPSPCPPRLLPVSMPHAASADSPRLPLPRERPSRRPASGPRVPRCPARPCATSSWATSECPTSPSSAPAAAARIWLLLADKPHAASAAWLHQIGCPSRPACLPRLPLPRERPPRRHASGPRASRDGPHPPPRGDFASRPGATPASLPPLPGAPRRGAARRRSSPRLGRSSAPRWWGSP